MSDVGADERSDGPFKASFRGVVGMFLRLTKDRPGSDETRKNKARNLAERQGAAAAGQQLKVKKEMGPKCELKEIGGFVAESRCKAAAS